MTQHPTPLPSPTLLQTSRRHVLKGLAGGVAMAALAAAGWTVEAGRSGYIIDGATSGTVDGRLRIIVLFGHPEDPVAFEEYYHGTHVPLALRMPLFQTLEGCKAVSDAAGGTASFYRIATISFESLADLETCLASAEGMTAFADVLNFATGGATATIVRDIQMASPAPVATSPQRGIERRTP